MATETITLPAKTIESISPSTIVRIHDADVEGSTPRSEHGDPFLLKNGIVSEDGLAVLRKRPNKGKKVEEYQRQQNHLIGSLLKPMEEHTEDARKEEQDYHFAVRLAVWASLIANFCLCIIQMWAAVTAGSYSLLATGIDAIFDFGSNVVLYWLHKKALKMDTSKWPVGGSRLETIGNIVYGFAMGSVNLVIIVESARSLIEKNVDKDFHLPSIIAVGAALLTKLILFLYCYSIRYKSSQVEVLWEDHRNDIFINGFGILMSAGGSKLAWWLDATGAIVIACGVMAAWGTTIYKQFELLAGKSAPHDFLQLIIYKAATYSDKIEKIDTVRAYHSGPDYFVEVDIVMDKDTPLWMAHDVAQELQDRIEVLPNVERAFVHVDHETTHAPEHRKTV